DRAFGCAAFFIRPTEWTWGSERPLTGSVAAPPARVRACGRAMAIVAIKHRPKTDARGPKDLTAVRRKSLLSLLAHPHRGRSVMICRGSIGVIALALALGAAIAD